MHSQPEASCRCPDQPELSLRLALTMHDCREAFVIKSIMVATATVALLVACRTVDDGSQAMLGQAALTVADGTPAGKRVSSQAVER